MSAFDSSTIHQLTTDLAGNLLRVWARRSHNVPPDYATAEQLTNLLEPGVAAFIARLMILAPQQEAALPGIMAGFFGILPVAMAIDQMLFDTADTTEELLQLLYESGLQYAWPVQEYFGEALAMFVAAVSLTNRIETEGEEADLDSPLTSLPPFTHFSDYVADQTRELVWAIHREGLDRIEMGQVVAADGDTILFAWPPIPMAGTPPDYAESIGPEEMGGELAGETGSGSEPPESEPAKANGGGSGPPPPQPPSPPPPQPPAPEPAITPEVVALRLDAALPERVTVGRAFDLAVAIKQLGSPPLAPDDLARRESAPFSAVWTGSAPFIQLRVQVGAPDCAIHDGDTRSVRLFAGQDGPPVYFQLTPQRAGPLSVIITVYQETDWVGSTRLKTEAGESELRGAMALTINSRPLDSPEVNDQTLWKALVEGYNETELQDLCFELSIDFEELPGDTKSAKARELVRYAKRRAQTAALVERVMASRPHLLAPV